MRGAYIKGSIFIPLLVCFSENTMPQPRGCSVRADRSELMHGCCGGRCISPTAAVPAPPQPPEPAARLAVNHSSPRAGAAKHSPAGLRAALRCSQQEQEPPRELPAAAALRAAPVTSGISFCSLTCVCTWAHTEQSALEVSGTRCPHLHYLEAVKSLSICCHSVVGPLGEEWLGWNWQGPGDGALGRGDSGCSCAQTTLGRAGWQLCS